MRRPLFLFYSLVCVCAAAPFGRAMADIYRRIDANGIWHISNRPLGQGYQRWVMGREGFVVSQSFSEHWGAGEFDAILQAASLHYQLDPALLKAMAAQESGFNPRALSVKGAMGVMQLMPQTAKLLGVNDPFDATQSIWGGAHYLRMLLDRFDQDIRLAVAAYNCGERNVRKVMRVPNIPETQDYVARVFQIQSNLSQNPEAFNRTHTVTRSQTHVRKERVDQTKRALRKGGSEAVAEEEGADVPLLEEDLDPNQAHLEESLLGNEPLFTP